MASSKTTVAEPERHAAMARPPSSNDVRPGAGLAAEPASDPVAQNALAELRALRGERQSLRRALEFHAELTRLALNGAGFSRIASTLAAFAGHPVLIENRFFRTLASAGMDGPLPRDDRPASLKTLLKAPALQEPWPQLHARRQPFLIPADNPPGRAQARIVAPIVVGDDVVGYLSIVGSDPSPGQASALLAEQAALAIGIEFSRQQAALETELRLKGNILELVLRPADISSEARAARAALLDYDVNAPQTLLLLAAEPRLTRQQSPIPSLPPSLHELAGLVAAWARQVSSSSLVAEKDGQIVLLLAGPPPAARPRTRTLAAAGPARRQARGSPVPGLSAAQIDLVAALRRQIASCLPAITLSVAIAPPVRDAHEVQQSYEVARRALTILKILGEHEQVISTTDPRLAVFFLFDSTRSETRREFVDLVLGPLMEYDRRGRRALVATLEAYLAHGGSLEATARALKIHTSTLKYRLQRIAEVSGLDVHNADHRFNAALALKLSAIE